MAPVKATRDKTEMRRLISHLDVGRAEFMLCSHFEDLAAFWHKLNGPLILKPAKGSGSEGVSLIRRTEELAKAWVRSTAPKVMPLIAEEYFDGPEFSVESLTVDGTHEILAVTQKITTGELGFVETGHQMPAPISKAVFQQMATSVTQFLQAVGHAVGPAHTELRLTAKGPRIIESNTRPGGDFIWQMVELVCGVDLVAATLADLAHVPQPKRKPVAPAAAVRFFAYANGRVTHLDQTEKAAELPGIVRFHCSLAVGAELGPLRSSDDRQGFVVAIGESLAQAMERADNAIAAVRLELAPQTAQ